MWRPTQTKVWRTRGFWEKSSFSQNFSKLFAIVYILKQSNYLKLLTKKIWRRFIYPVSGESIFNVTWKWSSDQLWSAISRTCCRLGQSFKDVNVGQNKDYHISCRNNFWKNFPFLAHSGVVPDYVYAQFLLHLWVTDSLKTCRTY